MLWIDDEPAITRYATRFLGSQGLTVECAPDGRSGLAMARSASFSVIVLDLRLGDIDGEDVLRALRGDGIGTPVIVLTGCGTATTAFDAGRLGATMYREKPLVGDALLQTLADAARAGGAIARPLKLFRDPCGIPAARLIDLRRSVGLTLVTIPAQQRAGWFAARLARVLVDRELTFEEFRACVRAFRVTVGAGTDQGLTPVDVHQLFDDVLETVRAPVDDRVARVVERLEAAGRAWPELTESRLAADLGLHPVTLWRAMATSGLTFARCRRLVVVRRALLDLAGRDDHVRQVAYRAGYEHASQFDREFRATLDIAPKGFRALLAAQESVQDPVKQ